MTIAKARITSAHYAQSCHSTAGCNPQGKVSSVTASEFSNFSKDVFFALPCKCTSFWLTLKIVIRLDYCFQSAHSQTIPQLVFIVIRVGESSFNLSRAVIMQL